MRRVRAWFPMLAFLGVLGVVQGLVIAWWVPAGGGQDAGDNRSATPDWSWSGIMRDGGPLMERVPAPYVVLTIIGCAAVAMIGWSLLVRWTDIDEAL